MTNQEIADTFRRLADLLEIEGENPFKIRSYRTAAESIEDTPAPLEEMLASGGQEKLREIPGIGEAIGKKIADLIHTGSFKLYDEVRSRIPESALDLLRVEGVGIKTLQILYHQFKITSLADFAKFVDGGGLSSVPRLGEKSHERIRQSLRELGC